MNLIPPSSAPHRTTASSPDVANKATSDEVVQWLRAAYGDKELGRTGYATLGHSVESASGGGLTYGELLPAGVSKALARMGASVGRGTLLELGCGTGKVAVQAFLECPEVARVFGIELSPARFQAAVAAAERLAGHSEPGQPEARFARTVCAEDRTEVTEVATGRKLELVLGDLTQVPVELVREASYIFLQVVLPEAVEAATQRLLLEASDGCVAFLLPNLVEKWSLPQPCNFHAAFGPDDRFATSWSAEGHRFYIFQADRSRPASITTETALRLAEEATADGHEL